MRFLTRRLIHSAFLLLGVSILSFVFVQLAPGSFWDEMRLNPQISQQTIAQLRQQYGMDRPLPVRYFYWLESATKGEWGISFAYNTAVAPLIWSRARNTLLLTGTAMVLSWAIALVLGVLSADRRYRWLDHASNILTSTLMITTDLLLALALLWLGVHVRWLHTGGISSPGSDSFGTWHRVKDFTSHLAGPVLVLVSGSLPVLFRHTRSAVADALDTPYIRSVRAHGIPQSRILFRHALPAAAGPLVSLFGLSLASLLSASLLIEVVMSWPGLGPLLLEAILARDFYVVIGSVMLSAVLLVGGILISDILLLVVDPRIRMEGSA